MKPNDNDNNSRLVRFASNKQMKYKEIFIATTATTNLDDLSICQMK